MDAAIQHAPEKVSLHPHHLQRGAVDRRRPAVVEPLGKRKNALAGAVDMRDESSRTIDGEPRASRRVKPVFVRAPAPEPRRLPPRCLTPSGLKNHRVPDSRKSEVAI